MISDPKQYPAGIVFDTDSSNDYVQQLAFETVSETHPGVLGTPEELPVQSLDKRPGRMQQVPASPHAKPRPRR